jgi:hypothetical protein
MTGAIKDGLGKAGYDETMETLGIEGDDEEFVVAMKMDNGSMRA